MNKKTIRLILNLLIVVLACVLVFAVVQLVGYWREYHANRETQKQVQQLFYGETNEQQVSAVQSESSQAAESSSLDPVIAANPIRWAGSGFQIRLLITPWCRGKTTTNISTWVFMARKTRPALFLWTTRTKWESRCKTGLFTDTA